MTIVIKKSEVGQEFLLACKRYTVSETDRTITVSVPLDKTQEAMLESGQLTRRQITQNIHSFIF